jgi:hypothetical protein
VSPVSSPIINLFFVGMMDSSNTNLSIGHGEILARMTSRIRGDSNDDSQGRQIDGLIHGRSDNMVVCTTTGDIFFTDHAADGQAIRVEMKTGLLS